MLKDDALSVNNCSFLRYLLEFLGFYRAAIHWFFCYDAFFHLFFKLRIAMARSYNLTSHDFIRSVQTFVWEYFPHLFVIKSSIESWCISTFWLNSWQHHRFILASWTLVVRKRRWWFFVPRIWISRPELNQFLNWFSLLVHSWEVYLTLAFL